MPGAFKLLGWPNGKMPPKAKFRCARRIESLVFDNSNTRITEENISSGGFIMERNMNIKSEEKIGSQEPGSP